VEEYEVGLNAVAAPVRGADASVVAALSISGPAYRLAPDSFPDVAERVVAAADEVSTRMGFFG
jgi:DNA-binding IclR family transcriptional regulator